tara:strand:+ start:6634 stop:8364 length:1731 start_codon:yes stop_codon:yes gene_type:complete
MSALALMFRLTQMMVDKRLGVRDAVFIGMAGEGVGILLLVAGPLLLKLLVDRLSQPHAPSAPMVVAVILFALTAAAAGLIAALRHHSTTRIVEAIAGDLAVQLLAARLPIMARNPDAMGGRLLGQIERLPFSLHLLIDGFLWQAVPLMVQMAVAFCVILAVVPWIYAVLIGLTLAGYCFVTMVGAERYQHQAVTANERSASLTACVADLLRNAPRVIFNGNMDAELARAALVAGERAKEAGRGTRSLVLMAAVQCSAVTLGLVLLLGLAVRDVLAFRLTVGDLILLQAYVLRLVLPLGGFGFLLRQAGRAVAQIRETLALIDGHARSPSCPDPLPDGPARVQLADISFAFDGIRHVVLDVSATIEAGSLTVLVGANGSGKSTLARLIAGLLDPLAGSVDVNGVVLADVPREHRHRHILYVPQHIGLFARSLGENGLYPPAASEAQCLQRRLQALHFYPDDRMPELDMPVGEGGHGLSGGQIQKLELARLASAAVPVLILDEATSALDPQSETAAIKTLRRERAQSTIILVTHRRHIARMADHVLFLVDGALRCAGTDEALAQRADYRNFWHRAIGA